MYLSHRDAFRPCSRDSSGDKVNFVFLAKKKHTFFNWNRPPSQYVKKITHSQYVKKMHSNIRIVLTLSILKKIL